MHSSKLTPILLWDYQGCPDLFGLFGLKSRHCQMIITWICSIFAQRIFLQQPEEMILFMQNQVMHYEKLVKYKKTKVQAISQAGKSVWVSQVG